jgi:hypothetical protein
MLTFVILTIIFSVCAIIYGILGAAKEPCPKTVEKPRPTIRVTVGSPEKDVPVRSLRYFCVKDKGYNVTVWPKDQYIGDYLEFKIAGITHGEHVSEHLGEFVATLEPEPTNPYDPNAIRIVTSEGHRVGYIPRDLTDCIRDFATLPCPCYCYIGTNDGIYFSDCYISRI